MINKQFKFRTHYKKQLADTVTPVSIYLKLRDQFANSFLLESSDYHGDEDSYSYICCDPIAHLALHKSDEVKVSYPDETSESISLKTPQDLVPVLSAFASAFEADDTHQFDFVQNGLFGFMSYDAVQHFEEISFDNDNPDFDIPKVMYNVFRYVIVLHHFKNELYIFEHTLEGEAPKGISVIQSLIDSKNFPSFSFATSGEVSSNFTDQEYLEIVKRGIHHCDVGDVFQIVLSRRFKVGFKGDEFQVYRALRSINPSPYLFYFDYGNFKIFGSSPEAQIVIQDREATIYPIAGTFRRTGDDQADAALAKQLHEDPKENSEHIMLVDLARNDLSKSSDKVTVETYKEIQYFSHVIHLVSKVVGQLKEGAVPLEMVASTFPAGTLSGAPKHKAMQLIDHYENTSRGYYGGAIGFMGFDGAFNHAIMIRSFLSQNNQLNFQAGAGVVSKSNPDSEVQEVYNKLAALQYALEEAEKI
ncbi:MAG: anthranilate synthase component I family protein [Bacteroidota bacterium]